MAPNSFAYSQLPKRRRRSTPTSPTSPLENSNSFPHASEPSEIPSPPSPSARPEKPATERSKPSTRYRIPSFAESPNLDFSFDPALTALSRFSDEHRPQRSPVLPEHTRPSTSAAPGREADRSGRYFAPALFSEPQSKPWVGNSPSESRPSSARGLWGKKSDSSPKEATQQVWALSSPSASAHSPKISEESHYHGREHSRNISAPSLATERSTSDDATAANKGPSAKAAKGRLHLLNPMSLLARRRASQAQVKPDDVNIGSSNLAVPAMPDNYDPRIRGKIVHDFSAPRPRRLQSYQDGYSAENSPTGEFRPNLQTPRRASDLPGLVDASSERHATLPKHSPMFKEHFNDDRQALQPGNKGYLHSMAALAKSGNDQIPAKLPAFAKKLPIMIPEKDETSAQRPRSPLSGSSEPTIAISPPTPLGPELQADSQVVSPMIAPIDPPPPIPVPTSSPPPVPQLSPPPVPEASPSPIPQAAPPPIPQASPSKDHKRSHLPKHMKSTSSRFSFQLGGADSAAQEKILEEKHKQQAALKGKVEDDDIDQDPLEDEYDDYDLDDDDGLEERIPGVNADPDDELEDAFPGANADLADALEEISGDSGAAENAQIKQPAKIETFHFTPASTILSPTTTNATSQPTPRDESGQLIGFAHTTYSPTSKQSTQPDQSDIKDDESTVTLNGLGITTLPTPSLREDAAAALPHRPQEENFDDDMYFDDGNFDDFLTGATEEEFDEGIFDDESGRIRDIPAQNAKKLEAAQQRLSTASQGLAYETASHKAGQVEIDSNDRKQVSFADIQLSASSDDAPLESDLVPLLATTSTVHQRGGLTEGNLAAYHDALVSAANEAAAKGRFSRPASTSQASEDQGSSSQLHDNHPGLVSDDSRIDLEHIGDDETFPFDDDLDDDLMIAEANAEVLENDDEGFYGEEFGFYARPHGKNDAELVDGGYFGPRGVDGIKRSHSGKANFLEPSLTPITERSEWSTRNSVASLIIPGGPYSAQPLPSPGIAQLLDLDPGSFEDDEMSMSTLLKLRRGAWGGSSTSVNSLGGSQIGSSPLANTAPRDFASHHTGNGHKMSSSVHSLTESIGIPESEEEDDYEGEVLTLMQNTPRKKPSDPLPSTPQSATALSPLSASSDKGKSGYTRGHSRTSSGAESISYVKDPEGSGRWVLERRRTGDDGEPEIVGREYLAGARI